MSSSRWADGPAFVIIGAGGHGRELLDIVDSSGRRNAFSGFVDDVDPTGVSLELLTRRGATVVGSVDWLCDTDTAFAIGIGSSSARRSIDAAIAESDRAASRRRTVVSLIHPTTSLGSDLDIGDGVVVGALSVITTNVRLGRHTHVNAGCSVQHDSVLGNFVTVSPGVFINGDVEIGDDVFLGTGAIVTRGCTIGSGAVIGAGAVVLDDVPAGARVMGIPGRPVH